MDILNDLIIKQYIERVDKEKSLSTAQREKAEYALKVLLTEAEKLALLLLLFSRMGMLYDALTVLFLLAKSTIPIIIIFVMLLTMALPAFATYKQNIFLPKDKKWMTAGHETRNFDYSYVRARCHSVYPESGTDNFTTIKCQVKNSSGTVISKQTYSLKESASSNTKVYIKEGYLSASPVYFQFRGNTNKPAYAVVSYYG